MRHRRRDKRGLGPVPAREAEEVLLTRCAREVHYGGAIRIFHICRVWEGLVFALERLPCGVHIRCGGEAAEEAVHGCAAREDVLDGVDRPGSGDAQGAYVARGRRVVVSGGCEGCAKCDEFGRRRESDGGVKGGLDVCAHPGRHAA